MAEQDTFNEILGDCGTVDGHKSIEPSTAQSMDELSKEFLAYRIGILEPSESQQNIHVAHLSIHHHQPPFIVGIGFNTAQERGLARRCTGDFPFQPGDVSASDLRIDLVGSGIGVMFAGFPVEGAK
jgi:hypothetical protein